MKPTKVINITNPIKPEINLHIAVSTVEKVT